MPPKPGAPPSIYANMAEMLGPGAKPPGGPAGGPGGSSEEKKQIVMTLFEVFKKWDKLEQDEAGKALIQQMMDLAKKYQTEVLKEGGAKEGAAAVDMGGGMPPPAPAPKGEKAEPVPA